MVKQHYRWDFVGLSTDNKPTSETSEKVVNGSTFYCSDTSKLYVYCDGTWYERKPLGGGGGGGTSDFDELDNRPKYDNAVMTSSTNIPKVPTVNDATLTITQNGTSKGTFTANDADDTTIEVTDTTYSNFTGTDGTAAGTAGLVPAPATTDAGKFLKADGTWDTAGGSSVNVVQTTGTSTTDVMSQNAVTSMVYDDPSTKQTIKLTNGDAANRSVAIGYNSYTGSGISGESSVAIGTQANTYGASGSIAIGQASRSRGTYSVSIGFSTGHNGDENLKDGQIMLGAYSGATRKGEMNIGSSNTAYGFNSSNYRLISGVYDGQDLHDAATVAQGNTLSTSAPTTATEGVLGQLWTDTTNMHTYQCTAISGSTYTWTQRW